LEHQHKWSPFRTKVDPSTLRICKNISGHADARIIPEDIFVSDIEPTLMSDDSVHFLSHKSFYNRWFSNGIFPKDIFHRIEGQYLDADLERSNFEDFKQASKDLVFPVILKPNKDTYGGMDINIVKNYEELLSLAKERKNFVLQEKIKQHEFFDQLYPDSLNTIKVFLYRSVKDDELHILSMALRMGKDGSLDNETAGGINTYIRDDGYLNGYAVDKHGTKYQNHPNTKLEFSFQLPELDKLKSLALKVGEKIFFSRIFALDVCFDDQANWRVIEVNTLAQSIRFSQYGGQPFFGEFTDEVIAYCKEHHWGLR